MVRLSLSLFCTTSMPFCTTKMSNFLVTHYFYGGIVICAYQGFCFPCSFWRLFFHCRLLSPWWPLLAGRQHFSLGSLRNDDDGSFSVIHVRVNIKNNVEKDTTLLLFFVSKSRGGHAISLQKHLELPVVSYLLIEVFFTFVCLWCGRTDGRAYGHVIAKISRVGRLLNFPTHSAPLRALRARGAPLSWMFDSVCQLPLYKQLTY